MAHEEKTLSPADGARLDFSGAMSYGDYLRLDQVLATLTPAEYSSFRGDLGSASGFQSYQYRAIEFLLGNKDAVKMEPHRHRAELFAGLEELHREPSLYDEAIRLLGRRGFRIDRGCLERDWRVAYAFDESVCQAWVAVYRSTAENWDLYELAEKLVDLEDAFRQWRFRHATTVERVIGFKRGTGGTSGVSYLRRVVEVELFPELWRARTAL